jgi:hypothetical protein
MLRKSPHEAGHAVAARSLGLVVISVDMRSVPTEVAGNLGAVMHETAGSLLGEDAGAGKRAAAYENDAMVALAGLAAQRRAYPDLTPDTDDIEEDAGDVATARKLVHGSLYF